MATRKNIRILLDDGNQIERGTGIGRYSQYVFDFLQRSGFQIDLTDRRFAGGDRTRKRLEYLWHINSRTYQRELEARYDFPICIRRHFRLLTGSITGKPYEIRYTGLN